MASNRKEKKEAQALAKERNMPYVMALRILREEKSRQTEEMIERNER
jgi:hypothetical protein